MTGEKINKEKNTEAANSAEAADIISETETSTEKESDKKTCKCSEKQLAGENKRLNAKVSELTVSLEKYESELKETQDKYLRVLAEYDNFRKRSAKEREGIFTDAYADALKEILPIIDNLERAAQFSESEQLAEGLSLILKSAKETLEKLGVEVFGAVGEQFDPQIHNAVLHGEDEEAGTNEIVEIYQKGYRKGDRIIRHAMVKVVN